MNFIVAIGLIFVVGAFALLLLVPLISSMLLHRREGRWGSFFYFGAAPESELEKMLKNLSRKCYLWGIVSMAALVFLKFLSMIGV